MKKILLSAVFALCGFAAGAQLYFGDVIPTDSLFRIGTLPNGMKYYLRHNEKPARQADFFIVYNVGAMQENDDQNGLAHFLEHMAFNGSENFPDKAMLDYLETIGVKFGQNLNAYTAQEQTVYMIQSVPLLREGIIDSTLLILHDWAGRLSLEDREIDNERGVILEEERTRQSANTRMQKIFMPVLFNGSKYAYRDVIGLPSIISSFPYETLRDYYKKWYHPDMEAVVIVGDIDVDQIEQKLKAVMAGIGSPAHPTPKETVYVPGNDAPLAVVATDKEATSTSVALMIKYAPTPDSLRNRVEEYNRNMDRNIALGALNERLRDIAKQENPPFITAASSTDELTSTCDIVEIYADAKNGEAAGAFEAAVTELERLRRYGITQAEFDRAIKNMTTSIINNWNRRNDYENGMFVQRAISNYLDSDPLPSPYTDYIMGMEFVKNASLERINGMVGGWIKPTDNVALALAPLIDSLPLPDSDALVRILARVRSSEIAAPENTVISTDLVEGGLKGSKVKKTQKGMYGSTIWTLKNGARIIALPTDHSDDEIRFYAYRHGGLSTLDDADVLSGKATVSVASQSGLGKYTNQELGKALTGRRATVNTSINHFVSSLNGSSSVKDLEALFELLYLRFTAPRFDQTAYKLYMDNTRTYFENIQRNPMYTYSIRTNADKYGDVPLTNLITLESLDQVTLPAIERVYRKLFSNSGDYTFMFVGKFTLDQLKPLVEEYIGSIPATGEKLDWANRGMNIRPGRIDDFFAQKMENPKTTVTYIYSGETPLTTESSMAMDALTSILDIRYTKSIREEKGGTYGVGVNGSIYNKPVHYYDLEVYFDTDPKMADELMELINDEMVNIAQNGVTPEELGKFKEFQQKDFIEQVEKNPAWIGFLQQYYMFDLDTYGQYEADLKSLASEQIRALAAQIVADGNLIRVVMTPEQ